MRILFFCLALYSALIIYSEFASAQEEQVNPAMIIEAWTVETFTRVKGMPSGECIMSAEYDNGLELAFKGKNHKLIALRIKDVSRGKSNNVQGFIGLGLNENSYGLHSRMKDGKIDASLMTVPAVGEIIKELPMFRIRIGSKDYYFSSAGFEAGYEELLKCQGDNSLSTLKVIDSTRQSSLPQKAKEPKKEIISDDLPERPVYLFKGDNVEVEKPEIATTQPSTPEKLLPIDFEMDKGKNNMPLAMAMPMLIPSGYSYQFDNSVNGMAPVSWDASDSWEESLKQAVSTHGYQVTISDKNIRITGKAADKKPNIQMAETKPDAKMNDAAQEAVPDVVEKAAEAMAPKAKVMNARAPIKEGHKWTAAKGEKLETVLKRWSKDAGVKTQIELDNDPRLERDFVAIGSFEVAVNGLLQDVSINKVVKPSAVMDHGNEKMTHISGYEGGMIQANDDPAKRPNRWRALQGTDLQNVLERWSTEENIDFVWDTNQRFYIPQSIKTTTDYAEAVALLLSQFEGHPQRPTAKLNTDPDTGRKALIVQTIDAF